MGKIKYWKKIDTNNWVNENNNKIIITLWGISGDNFYGSINETGELNHTGKRITTLGTKQEVISQISEYMRKNSFLKYKNKLEVGIRRKTFNEYTLFFNKQNNLVMTDVFGKEVKDLDKIVNIIKKF